MLLLLGWFVYTYTMVFRFGTFVECNFNKTVHYFKLCIVNVFKNHESSQNGMSFCVTLIQYLLQDMYISWKQKHLISNYEKLLSVQKPCMIERLRQSKSKLKLNWNPLFTGIVFLITSKTDTAQQHLLGSSYMEILPLNLTSNNTLKPSIRTEH